MGGKKKVARKGSKIKINRVFGPTVGILRVLDGARCLTEREQVILNGRY